MTLKPSELTQLLVAAFRARRPILVEGAPGIGKSDIVEQARTLAGFDLILSHPAVGDPTDVKGMPWIVDGRADFVPFGDLRQAIEADKPTVWFFDDLGQAAPAMQAACMQLLLARRVNEHRLSEHVTFVAATNRRTDKAGVTGILEPVKSRFASIVELAADVNEWSKWAIANNVSPEIIAFLRFKMELLSNFQPTADLKQSPSPRTWSHVNAILQWNLSPNVQHAAIVGAVGEGAATEFSAFLKLYRELPNVDQILLNPMSIPIPKVPNVLYALAGALAHKATPANFTRVAQFCDRLSDAGSGEFAILILRDAIQRQPEITQTTAFVRLATSEIGALLNGGK